MILGQLDLAVELLEAFPRRRPAAHTVHETRKALKRLRALLRLLRGELGEPSATRARTPRCATAAGASRGPATRR